MPASSVSSSKDFDHVDFIADEHKQKSSRVVRSFDENGMSFACCRTVGHTQQRFNWDCGLSCVLMALDAAEEFDAKEEISRDIEKVCKSEGFGHSTWTIDLCYLLKNYAPELAFSYTTITLGVDPSYMDQVFYNSILKLDSDRVQKRFKNAKSCGIDVSEQSVDIERIIEHIADSGTCIVLTNANILSCETCNFFNLCGAGENATNTSCLLLRHCRSNAYQGHYVLAVGFDIPKKKIYYRNPTLRDRVCVMSFDRFDEARNSYGTDKDVIFVSAVD